MILSGVLSTPTLVSSKKGGGGGGGSEMHDYPPPIYLCCLCRWSHDEKYFARMSDNLLSVYSVPVSVSSTWHMEVT